MGEGVTPTALTALNKGDTQMTNYKIKVKRDFGKFGWYDSETRSNRRDGFVVTDGICNVIPGACWFKTIEDAMVGVQAHMMSGDTMEWHSTYAKLKSEKNATRNIMGGA
jgi:hypothetical protein